MKQVRVKLMIQGDSFRDELHLLLLQVLDPQMVATMINDQNHSQWQAKELEEKLRFYLGSKYGSFEQTIKEIRETIDDLLQKFSAFAQSKTIVRVYDYLGNW
ncbi:hypothetical protein F4781DRAFT_407154 [Annulohypoxylon bovei var. microspora]|nr:hypothetical protein F4781DRAFT_407154 [Annulohypoxylon bovei var. microspora]